MGMDWPQAGEQKEPRQRIPERAGLSVNKAKKAEPAPLTENL